MANIKYRVSSSADATLTSTTIKGTPLTNIEVDANFYSLNADIQTRAPIANPAFTGYASLTGPGSAPGSSWYGQTPMYTVINNFAGDTVLGVSNNNSGTSALTSIRLINGVANLYASIILVNNGAYWQQDYGSGVNYAFWTWNGVEKMRLTSGGALTATSFNSITALSSTNPVMNGTVSIGASTDVARADHVHPTDTSRAPIASPTFTGVLTSGGAIVEKKNAISTFSGASVSIDLSLGSFYSATLTAAITSNITVTNVASSGNVSSFVLDLTNGGAYSISWMAGIKWASGTAPTLTASGRDVLGFFTYDAGTTWNGLLLAKDIR